jgi:taurine dioxygenase
LDFSRAFGSLDKAPITERGRITVDGIEEIYAISNILKDGEPIGALGAGESAWHSDMTYVPDPPYASCLYAREVPVDGGNTGFANAYLAYERLPASLRVVVDGLSLKHDTTTNSGGYIRLGYDAPKDVSTSPGGIHPLVLTHPDTGRKALFLGRRLHAYIVGLSVAESEALLDEIWKHAVQPELTWHHQWAVGDLVMWDNRFTLHRRDPFPDTQRRLMHRTQIRHRRAA